MSQQKVTVRILDREYQFAASEAERNSLLSAADQLDTMMRSIKDNSPGLGADKVAIMAALNVSYEMLQLKDAQKKVHGLTELLQKNIIKK